MADAELSSDEAARRLGVSRPTIRKMLEEGKLSGRAEPRGTRFTWRISEDSVTTYLEARTTSADLRRQGKRVTVSQLKGELDKLRDELTERIQAAQIAPSGGLRAEVTTLREALVQQRAITEAITAADQARSEVVKHLIAAVSASETADERRRDAIAAAEAMVGQFVTPGTAEGLAR